uniref:Uncharacterized protein n=1 Tax=Biomphalaria glabrata TaxID=6526 RepID=A0A2C9LXK3_BIOGL
MAHIDKIDSGDSVNVIPKKLIKTAWSLSNSNVDKSLLRISTKIFEHFSDVFDDQEHGVVHLEVILDITPVICPSGHVRVGCEGSCAQYGMVAVDDIPEGYCLFQIPRNCLIMPENSDIAELVEKEKQSLSVTNQWIPLLLTLVFETNNPSSKWKPYLDLFPNPDSIDLPIFWESSEVNQLLQGTGVDAAVKRDLGMIQNDFEKLVVPFVQKYSKEL